MESFNDNKAGLEGLDKAKIEKIIGENTSTNYQDYSRKQLERIEARIKQNELLMECFSDIEIAKAESEMDRLAVQFEAKRSLSQLIVHIDMDAFYAAVEMRDKPSLRDVPMAVGSSAMLSTSNYVARRFGVRSAMPGFIARKLCPELRIIPCNIEKYRSVSYQVKAILLEYDPELHMGSLDEAYMNLTGYMETRMTPVSIERCRYGGNCICRLPRFTDKESGEVHKNIKEVGETCCFCGKFTISYRDTIQFGICIDEVVREIRFRVEQKTGLTCSAGIGPNSMIAKICSDINKPNGQFRIENEKSKILKFMEDLPIRKVSGIGKVTEAVLKGAGMEKCGDLYAKRGLLRLLFTQCSYEYFLRIALGISSWGSGSGERERKSISVERTFQPTGDINILLETIHGLCDELIESLPDYGVCGGHSVTVKMKFATFDVITRCISVDFVVNKTVRLFELSGRLTRQELDGTNKQLRLLGVRLSRLVFEGEKVELTKSLALYWMPKPHSLSERSKHLDNQKASTSADIVLQQIPCNIDEDLKKKEFKNFSPKLQCQVKVGDISENTRQKCPICEANLPPDLTSINQHVDECLNRDTIKELVGIDDSSCSDFSRRVLKPKRTIEDTSIRRFICTNKKRKNTISDYFNTTAQ